MTMKTNRLTARGRKSPAWNHYHWLLAILIAFTILIIIGLVFFFLFPNKAI